MKRKIPIHVFVTVIALFIVAAALVVVMKGVVIVPFMYADNPTLDTATNNEIKEVVIDFVRDRYSKFYKFDKTDIYSPELAAGLKKNGYLSKADMAICPVETGFMRSLMPTHDGGYVLWLRVPSYDVSDDRHWEIKVMEMDGEYRITYCEIDPKR